VSVRVLLSDGSGLTARQVATQLSVGGHTVEVLTPDRLSLARFTGHVRRVHRVPVYGAQPFGWLDRALAVYREGHFDVLVPTHEQVAVLSRCAEKLHSLGVATTVPPFDALLKLQDKRVAFTTLAALGIPQPSTSVVHDADELSKWERLPAFIKTPIGTASNGVRYVTEPSGLANVASTWQAAGVFANGGVLVQAPVAGELIMVQSVFCEGRLVASHAYLRSREGTRGGASHKKSVDLPAAREHLAALGGALSWHGALSAEAILTNAGPVYIDINPRLVEPGNAWRAGVDLVTPMLDLALAKAPVVQRSGKAGIATHSMLLAVRRAAENRHPRRAVCSEIILAARHRKSYSDSVEELTPVHRDPRSALFVATACLVIAIRPTTWRSFSSRSVSNYALTPAAWYNIVAGRALTDSVVDRQEG
jgi:biotin carboxylase